MIHLSSFHRFLVFHSFAIAPSSVHTVNQCPGVISKRQHNGSHHHGFALVIHLLFDWESIEYFLSFSPALFRFLPHSNITSSFLYSIPYSFSFNPFRFSFLFSLLLRFLIPPFLFSTSFTVLLLPLLLLQLLYSLSPYPYSLHPFPSFLLAFTSLPYPLTLLLSHLFYSMYLFLYPFLLSSLSLPYPLPHSLSLSSTPSCTPSLSPLPLSALSLSPLPLPAFPLSSTSRTPSLSQSHSSPT